MLWPFFLAWLSECCDACNEPDNSKEPIKKNNGGEDSRAVAVSQLMQQPWVEHDQRYSRKSRNERQQEEAAPEKDCSDYFYRLGVHMRRCIGWTRGLNACLKRYTTIIGPKRSMKTSHFSFPFAVGNGRW